MKHPRILFTVIAALVSATTLATSSLPAAEWSWQYPNAADKTAAPKVEVCPLLYGKQWAYAVEIDDGPVTMASVIQPLLSRYQFTDAPPGIAGGKPLPFVAATAVVVQSVGTNNTTLLQWEQLRKLASQGCEVINHGYSHAGHSWEPEEKLSPQQFRKDLFWSQAILAAEMGNGRAPDHFVYPNGYLEYRKYLAEFGLRSATHVAGNPANWALYSGKPDLYDLQRAYLDAQPWIGEWGKGDVLFWFPKDGPATDSIFIDFTHGIDPDPASKHYKLWAARLESIASRFGKQGKDNMWSAPTGRILDYVSAAGAAKVKAEAGRLTVQLPDSIPGSRLTLKLTGIKSDPLAAPAGATIYRQGDTVWLTTPMIGQPGSPAPTPLVECIYSGPVKDMTWPKPIALAAVRVLQGPPPAVKGFVLAIDAITPEGKAHPLVTPEEGKLPDVWHRWWLYSTVPNDPALTTKELHITKDAALEKMEVWVVKP